MSDVAGASTSANDLDVASSVERTPERAREDDVDDEASPSSASSVEDAMRRLALVDASNELARDARRARFRSPTDAKMSPASRFVARKAHYAEPTSIEERVRERENHGAVPSMIVPDGRSRFAPKR